MPLSLLASLGCGSPAVVAPTFSQHIAPIIFENCTVCHRDGAAGPFPLVSYQQVADRGEQIAAVTASRYMPPWLPAESDHPFRGARRLTETELQLIQQWVDAKKPAGPPGESPPPPNYSSEWALGVPDWIGEMEVPYVRQPQLTDSWRNLVLPVDIAESKYVRTYDFDPGNPQAVHHAVILLDRTGSGKQRDDADAEPGFDGMQNGQLRFAEGSEMPDGQILGWTPGKIPAAGEDDIAWRIEPGDDLIVQLHIPASGKPESIRCRVALYFANQPPTRHPYSLALTAREIDIPVGETDYRQNLDFVLPVDVELLGVYPHAHYLCEEMLAYAELPDGTQQTLLHIPEWNFDWQDDYRFATPVALPRGTRIGMSYRYNNSSSNVRNPNHPPKRVVYGESSTDSMGDLLFQVVANNDADRQQLYQAYMKHQVRRSLTRHQQRVEQDPLQAAGHVGVGEAHLLLGEWGAARSSLERALELGDRDARTYAKIARTYQRQQNRTRYLQMQRRAIELAPSDIAFRREYAVELQLAGDVKASLEQFEAILTLSPSDVQSLVNAGIAWGRLGNVKESENRLRRALAIAPDFATAHVNLAITLRSRQNYEEAIEHLRQALQLEPHNAQTQAALLATIERSEKKRNEKLQRPEEK